MAARRPPLLLLLLLLLWPPPLPPLGCVVCGAVAGGVRLEAPSAVLSGAPLDLRCRFPPPPADLYSVKWYKDGDEFFRVAPSDAQPKRSYPVAGVLVDVDASNASHVRLLSVGPLTSGQFSCEVTEDAPAFGVFMDLKEVKVVQVEASQLPRLSGLKERYRPGEVVQADCVGPWSKPPAHLRWHVNGQLVAGEGVLAARPEGPADGLQRPALFLRLPAPPPGPLRLRCTADYHEAYHKVVEVSVPVEEATRVPFVDEERKKLPSEKASAVSLCPSAIALLLPAVSLLRALLLH